MSSTITIETQEGTLVYLGQKSDGTANWRLLKRKGRGTLPVPMRLQRQAKRSQQQEAE
jgi:hypothetical protein